MRIRNTYHELGQYAHDLICSKARCLVGTAGFTLDDCDDIEQELALDLLGRIPYFDPKKSTLKSFMARVIENRMITLIEERQAACRDWRCCLDSLDDPEWEMDARCDRGIDTRCDREGLWRRGTSQRGLRRGYLDLPGLGHVPVYFCGDRQTARQFVEAHLERYARAINQRDIG